MRNSWQRCVIETTRSIVSHCLVLAEEGKSSRPDSKLQFVLNKDIAEAKGGGNLSEQSMLEISAAISPKIIPGEGAQRIQSLPGPRHN